MKRKKNPLNSKKVEDHAFIHSIGHKVEDFNWKPYETDKTTKIELAVLLSKDSLCQLKHNLNKLRKVEPKSIFKFKNRKLAPYLLYQYYKKSDDIFTEMKKEFIDYNSTIYFVRAYKFVWARHYKLEITKVNYSKWRYLNKHNAVHWMMKFMKNLTSWASKYMLPHYYHQWTYTTIEEYLDTDPRYIDQSKEYKKWEELIDTEPESAIY